MTAVEEKAAAVTAVEGEEEDADRWIAYSRCPVFPSHIAFC